MVTVDATGLGTPPEEALRCGGATFAVRRCSTSRVAVAVLGEVDAVSGRTLGRYIEQHTRVSHQLILDLRAVTFFGTPGFTALYYTSVHCARRDVDWVIVGSPSVAHLLAVCDPDGDLPLVRDLSPALARLDRLDHGRHPIVWSGRSGWHAQPHAAKAASAAS